jgi:hypothetical protein
MNTCRRLIAAAVALQCSAPYLPSPDKTDQHMVVALTCAPTLVTLLGVICHLGIEPIDAALASTKGVYEQKEV